MKLTFCKSVTIFAILLVSVFGFSQKAFATTTISDGIISEDTNWTVENSPYVIEGSLFVPDGVTLTIDPGVVVKFADGASLDIDGNLSAVGTLADKIYFTSLEDDSIGGDTNNDGSLSSPFPSWSGYLSSDFFNFKNAEVYYVTGFFVDTTLSELENVYWAKSEEGLFFYNSVADIKNVVFEEIEDNPLTGSNTSNLIIENLNISNLFGGDDALVLYGNSEAKVTNSHIFNLDSASALVLYDSGVEVADSVFEDGLDSGIEFYDNDSRPGIPRLNAKNLTIKDFLSAGVYMYDDSSAVFDSSRIENNGSGIEAYDSSDRAGFPNLSISGSVIKNNIFYGVAYFDGLNMLDAKDNWWGDVSGPYNSDSNSSGLGNEVFGNVDFNPWLEADPFSEPPVAECCSSVVFLPGLQASRLYTAGFLSENQLWDPNRNADAQKLFLNDIGVPINNDIYTEDIIDEVFGLNIYKNFISFMDGLVSDGTIKEWMPMPYDWRLKISDIINNPVQLADGESYKIIDEVIRIAQESPTGKVTFIGHSNGGLVAKALVKELEARGLVNVVDKLVMVATPQLGTPKAVAALLHGDEQSIALGLVLSKPTARQLAENMPGAYTLLPSQKYFEEVIDPVITFDDSIKNRSGLSQYGGLISTFNSLQNFLLSAFGDRSKPATSDINTPNILNESLLFYADDFHQEFDDWTPLSNIKVIQITGWGLDTIKGIEYSAHFVCVDLNDPFCIRKKMIWDRRPLFTIEGDGTVVYKSSILSVAQNTFYLDLSDDNKLNNTKNSHKNILESESLMSLVFNIISNLEGLPTNVFVEKPSPILEDQKLRVSVHSPISLDLYDTQGRHTGIVPDSTLDLVRVEENIPNSYYLEFGEGKYAGLDLSQEYTVSMQGTGLGTFTLETQFISGDNIIKEEIFPDILVTSLTQASFSVGTTTDTINLSVDVDGDGEKDFLVKSGDEFDPILYLEMMKKTVHALDLKKNIEKQLIKKIDKLSDLIKKGKVKKIENKIEGIIKKVEMKKTKKISGEDKDTIVNMLNNLLDNLMI